MALVPAVRPESSYHTALPNGGAGDRRMEQEGGMSEPTATERLRALLDEHDEHYEQLEAENAKLRELVGDLFLQLLNAYDRKEVDEFADRLRELGEGV